jgi:hypothetical protein
MVRVIRLDYSTALSLHSVSYRDCGKMVRHVRPSSARNAMQDEGYIACLAPCSIYHSRRFYSPPVTQRLCNRIWNTEEKLTFTAFQTTTVAKNIQPTQTGPNHNTPHSCFIVWTGKVDSCDAPSMKKPSYGIFRNAYRWCSGKKQRLQGAVCLDQRKCASREPTIKVGKIEKTSPLQAARFESKVCNITLFRSRDPWTMIRVLSHQSSSTGFLHHHSLNVVDSKYVKEVAPMIVRRQSQQ